jgi:hypothetical protein
MAIPFRYDDEFKQMGLAAYLKIEPAAAGYRGALFLINGRGEPVEFTYTHIEIPQAFLWREADIRLHAARRITTALFSLCPRTPTLILCLAAEIDSRLFCHDVSVTIPVCRIAPAAVSVSLGSRANTVTRQICQSRCSCSGSLHALPGTQMNFACSRGS